MTGPASRIATVALTLALLAGCGWLYVERNRARGAAQRAEREAAVAATVQRFLDEDLLASVGADRRGAAVSLRELLDTAAGRVAERLADQPRAEVAVRRILARSYVALGDLDTSIAQQTRVVELERQLLGERDPETLAALDLLGWTLHKIGQPDRAEAPLRAALEGREAVLGPEHPQTLESMHNLAAALYNLGRPDEAEPLERRAVQGRSRVLGADHPDTLVAKTKLALALTSQRRVDEAEPLLREVLEGWLRTEGPDHTATLEALSNLALVYRAMGRPGAAEAKFVELIDDSRSTYGADDARTVGLMTALARFYAGMRRFDDAERVYLDVFAAQRRTPGDESGDPWRTLYALGGMYEKAGDPAKAAEAYRGAARGQEQFLARNHPHFLLSLQALADLDVRQGRAREAEPLYERIVSSIPENEPEWRWDLARRLSDVYLADGKPRAAADVLAGALESTLRIRGADHPDAHDLRYRLAIASAAAQDPERATRLLGELVRAGWADRARLDDPRLASLRGNPSFESLRAEASAGPG